MEKRKLYAIAGLLILSFALASCQPVVNGRAAAGPAQAAAATSEAGAVTTPSAGEPAGPTIEPQAVLTPASVAPVDDVMSLGDPGAPVTIAEFSDYQCPFCASYFRETWPQLKAAFVDTGRVRYVFKDFPLTNIHPQAPKAHEAARCAGEQGAYWDMHARLFSGQAQWGRALDHVAVLKDSAAELGLEMSDFETCLVSGRWASAVNADIAEGVGLGVRGTPTFFINGYPLVGAQPFENLGSAIELAEQGKLGEAYRRQ